jgi:hypothetical protein
MGTVLMNGPPDCPDGRWCPACLMDAKQRQWELNQDEVRAGYQASGEKLTVITWPAGLTKTLHTGAYRAVCGDFPGLGIVDDLCWNHVAGTNPSPGSTLATGMAGLPAGLRKRGQG